MYTDKKNVLQLIALLEAHSITKVVLCPGSRNVPLVQTFTNCRTFTCYSITDERSAGFFALGLSLEVDEPVVVCCTSGSALLNLHPAIAEAFYQQIPLIVISADRPAAWIGQMDGQTLPQSNVFKSLVRCSVNIPEIVTDEDKWYCNRLINWALLETNHHVKGPVHINVPLSEPLFNFTEVCLPKVRVIRRYNSTDSFEDYESHLLECLNRNKRRMILIGQMDSSDTLDVYTAKKLSTQFVLLNEHISNQSLKVRAIGNFDTLISALDDNQKKTVAPDLLITFGGHIVSKRLKNLIRKYPPKEHFHISENGDIIDLFGAVSYVIEMKPFEFLKRMVKSVSDNVEYTSLWKKMSDVLSVPKFSYSEMKVFDLLMNSLPKDCVLHLANSSSIRYAQLFPLKRSIKVYCNRGTSGIEGSLSTAIGYATLSNKLNFIVIGDLSFFYDMNALWNGYIRPNVRIVLLNNGGGEIFHVLQGLNMSDKTRKFITATHGTIAEGWACEQGFKYLKAENEAQLTDGISKLTDFNLGEKPVLLEVFTKSENDAVSLKKYYNSLSIKIENINRNN